MSDSPNMQWVMLETSRGPVDVLFDLVIEGDTLHLKDLSIYPRQDEPLQGLLPEMLAVRAEVERYARDAGFAKVRISGHRTEKSSSANPGKVIDIARLGRK
jgi:hypothetical protein